MSVTVKQVQTRADLRRFVDYPNQLYKDVPQFVPAFYGDDISDWDEKINPAFKYCEARAYLAYRDGKIVGRIGAILNHAANKKWGYNRMRFSQVDFIDDKEVSKALFDTVEKWAAQKGCDEVHGPLGFCDTDREGMLYYGYEQRGQFITYYNHPYYNEHLEAFGYTKDADWLEYKLPVPKAGDEYYERIHGLAQIVLKRRKYHKVSLSSHRQFKPYIRKFFVLVNEAYAGLYGVVELNEEQIEKYADKFVPLINPDYCCLVVDDNDDLVAMGVCAPSVASAMQKNRGRLFPFGWAGVLKNLHKNNAVDLLLMAVKPKLQGSGLNAVVIDHIMTSCIKNGIEYAETGPMLEMNTKILSQWKMFNLEPFKKRRCYLKKISE